jgi:hypothetical protein
MGRGQANRAVGSHDMNEHSSRSHSILTIVCRGRNSLDGTTTFGKQLMYSSKQMYIRSDSMVTFGS